ncbi:MAG: DUF6580 family putative transport protein [Limisphaerales bacterium]
MNEKRRIWLPVLFLVVLALTRIPGLLPPSFSGIYALAFCAGVFLPRKLAWALPVAFLFITDLLLNTLVYKVGAFNSYQWLTLLGFVSVIGLGRVFRPSDSWLKLLGGGILGAILFYLLTNSAAWFFNPYHNPEYTRDLTGWMVALTKGTSGFPPTWEFFRNTLLSGGLFTGLFVGAMKLNEAPEPETEEEAEEIPETEPEEGKA